MIPVHLTKLRDTGPGVDVTTGQQRDYRTVRGWVIRIAVSGDELVLRHARGFECGGRVFVRLPSRINTVLCKELDNLQISHSHVYPDTLIRTHVSSSS